MFAERIHSIFAAARMPAVAVEGVGQCCAEGEAGGQKDQDQCGCGHGYQKNDDTIWGTTQHL